MTWIKEADLVIGTVYEVRSRNLEVGVWTGRGFIGVREKFGSRFLFEEYYIGDEPGSNGPMGTAFALRPLGRVRPDIELVEGTWVDREDGARLFRRNTSLRRSLAQFERRKKEIGG